MIYVRNLLVLKDGNAICSLAELVAAKGERVAIVGNNGTGKTTLLRVLAGFEINYAGDCRVDVEPRHRVYVHQTPYMFRGTVVHNLTWGMRARGLRCSAAVATAQDLIRRLRIPDRVRAQCRDLSGGEQKRVAIARAVATKPALLLLDEPFAEVDNRGRVALLELLADAPDTTVVFTSPAPVADEFVTQSIELQQTRFRENHGFPAS